MVMMPSTASGRSSELNGGRSPEANNLVEQDLKYTPIWLRVSANWAWRLLVVGAAIIALWFLGSQLRTIVIPILVALLLTAGLSPMTTWLSNKGAPRWLGAMLAVLALVLVVLGLLTLVGAQFALQWSQLSETAIRGFREVMQWLATGPLQINEAQVNTWVGQMTDTLQNSQEQIATMVTTAGSKIGNFVAGLATTLFVGFFLLKDGHRIAVGSANWMPTRAQESVAPALGRGWTALTQYVRAAVTVAAIDGVGAGLGALILGSNLWLAIISLTFVCSFVPIIGAMIAGAISVVVVLVTLGPIKAVIMLVIFVAVMNIEANVLQPLLLGRAVEIHPLLVLLGILAGATLAGIAGAFFAIPLISFISGCMRSAAPAEPPRKPTLPNVAALRRKLPHGANEDIANEHGVVEQGDVEVKEDEHGNATPKDAARE